MKQKTLNAEYQEYVESTLLALKHSAYGTTVLHGLYNTTPFELLLLTGSCTEDETIISLLSSWRKANESWFLAQFPVSDTRTKVWLQNQVIGKPDRLLFMICISDTYIGHVGLNRFDYTGKTCELDNILRGESGYPGIIEVSLRLIMDWGMQKLRVVGYTLETMSDNIRALTLYKKLGFVEFKRMALLYKKTDEGGEWVIAPNNYKKPVKKHTVFMKQLHI